VIYMAIFGYLVFGDVPSAQSGPAPPS